MSPSVVCIWAGHVSRRLVAALGVLGLVIVCIVIALLLRNQPPPQPVPSPTPTGTQIPQQPTLLVAVRDDKGAITDAVVMSSATEPSMGRWLSLQPGLGLDIAITGTQTLAAAGPQEPGQTAAAVGNQLGAKVAGGFVMDRLAFAAMVDAVGGVIVNSAQPLVAIAPDGTRKVVVPAGRKRIYGPTAAEYVITLGPNESQAERMARFDDVWREIILRLPGNTDRVRSVIGSLGSSSRISVTPDSIADTLLEYQTALADRSVKTATLPTTSVGTGAGAVYTPEPAKTLAVVTDLFPESLLVPGVDGALPRIRFAAAGIADKISVQAKEVLTAAGYSFVWSGRSGPQSISQVAVSTPAQAALAGTSVARLLGLPKSSVEQSPEKAAGAQVALWAGADIFSVSPSPTTSPTEMVLPSAIGVTP